MGRASFLPISSVKGYKIDKIKGKEAGFIGIASDLIKYDKKYEQIILSLLGRTVLVDNMDTAIKVAKTNGYSFRIITLDGDVINNTGSITGGSVAKKTVNILGREKEIKKLEKQVKELKEKIQKLEEEKKQYENSQESVIEEVLSFEKQLQEVDISYAMQKQKVDIMSESIGKIEARISKLKEEQAELESQKAERQNRKQEIEKEIETLGKETEELTAIITEFASQNQETQKQVDDLNFDITNLKISVSSFDESEVSMKEIQERIRTEIENSNKNIQKYTDEIENMLNENILLEQSIKETKK